MFTFESFHHGETKTGEKVSRYLLSHSQGMRVEVSSFGATLLGVYLPSGINVAPCFQEISELENRSANPYMGALVGRVAGRTSNAKVVEPVSAFLASNDGENSIHGGLSGFDQKVWSIDETQSGVGAGYSRITLKLQSRDGDEGYPGELLVTVTYSLFSVVADKASLGIELKSQLAPGQPLKTVTPSCLTNHTYWALSGSGGGHPSQLNEFEAHDLEVTMNAKRLLPQRESDWMPSTSKTIAAATATGVGGAGERGVEGMLDFSIPGRSLRDRIARLGSNDNNKNYPGAKVGGGINAYFRVDEWKLRSDRLHPIEDNTNDSVIPHPRSLVERLLPAATFYECKSKRSMAVSTTMPGFVLYTNFGYAPVPPGSCICIETQYPTDSSNEIIDEGCEDEIPRCLLRAKCSCTKCVETSLLQPEVMHDLTTHTFSF